MNVLKLLARAGVEPRILMKLYQCYISSLFEYGSPSFIAAPKEQIIKFERLQNEAIRISLRLPRYIRTALLHEYAGTTPLRERLRIISESLLVRMRTNNEHIKQLIDNHESATTSRHSSPLDLLLP